MKLTNKLWTISLLAVAIISVVVLSFAQAVTGRSSSILQPIGQQITNDGPNISSFITGGLEETPTGSTPAGGNDFSTDPNCVALYNFESNATLTTDSVSNNTLCAINDVECDSSFFKQGAGGANFPGTTDYFTIANELLHEDFPTKNETIPSRTFSVCFWVNPIFQVANAGFVAKDDPGFQSWYVMMRNTTHAVRFSVYEDGGGISWFTHDSSLTENKWYHVGITFDGDNGPNFAYRIRIWDDEAGAILGVDKTGTTTTVLLPSDSALYIGTLGESPSLREHRGFIDEVVFFKDVLTVDEIDAIRAGTYAGP